MQCMHRNRQSGSSIYDGRRTEVKQKKKKEVIEYFLFCSTIMVNRMEKFLQEKTQPKQQNQ